jgi:peptide/nickel transport system permease protein
VTAAASGRSATHVPARPIVGPLFDLVRRRPLGAIGAAIVLLAILTALGAPWIAPHDPLEFRFQRLAPPAPDFLLGSDNFGRDVLSRVIWGARTSLYVGIGALLLGQLGGGTFGIVSAYFGGKLDLISQRVVDVMMVFPTLVLALTIAAVLGSSLNNVVLAIAIAQAPGTIRTMRAAGLSAKATLYVEAARSVGCTGPRIIARHLLPNVIAPFLVVASAAIGAAIVSEASLSFLGLGVPPPQPSWGGMMSGSGRTYLAQAPWIAVAPGIALSLVVLGFNFLGDAIRDATDPRLRRA